MKALYHDWNDGALTEGQVWAWRAREEWPMPEVGETVAVGHENCFFAGHVDDIAGDRVLVILHGNRMIPVPLGWPHDEYEQSMVGLMHRERRYREALDEIKAMTERKGGDFARIWNVARRAREEGILDGVTPPNKRKDQDR